MAEAEFTLTQFAKGLEQLAWLNPTDLRQMTPFSALAEVYADIQAASDALAHVLEHVSASEEQDPSSISDVRIEAISDASGVSTDEVRCLLSVFRTLNDDFLQAPLRSLDVRPSPHTPFSIT